MYKNITDYKIRYTDVDIKDNIKLSSLASFMEEAACASADELGFGYDVIMPLDIGFILANWYIELYRPITLKDRLEVHTWPMKPSRTVFIRDYEFYSCGKKVAAATSRWCMMNLKNYSILPVAALPAAQNLPYNDFRAVNFNDWKIPDVGGELSYEKKVTYSDCDHYNHANNTKYADFCLDALPLNVFENKYVSSAQIVYSKQCKYGENIQFYKEFKDGFYYVNGKCGEESRVRFKVKLSDLT